MVRYKNLNIKKYCLSIAYMRKRISVTPITPKFTLLVLNYNDIILLITQLVKSIIYV